MGECEIGGGSESLALKDLVCFGSSDMCFWHLSWRFFYLQPFLCCQDLLGFNWVSSGFHLGLAWVCFRPIFSPHFVKEDPPLERYRQLQNDNSGVHHVLQRCQKTTSRRSWGKMAKISCWFQVDYSDCRSVGQLIYPIINYHIHLTYILYYCYLLYFHTSSIEVFFSWNDFPGNCGTCGTLGMLFSGGSDPSGISSSGEDQDLHSWGFPWGSHKGGGFSWLLNEVSGWKI